MRRERRRVTGRFGAVRVVVLATGMLLAIGAVASAQLRPAPDKALLVGHGVLTSVDASTSGAATAALDVEVASPGSFSIAGSVAGLYPGDKASMTLTVSNPQSFAITVVSISTVVSDASARCGAANVRVRSFSGALQVAAKKTAEIAVQVRMRRSAPNACQGEKFPFRYVGLATTP